MATKRTPIHRATRRKITPLAIDAWRKLNYTTLHMALGLPPWHASPLPIGAEVLGVDEEPPPDWITKKGDKGTGARNSLADWNSALELQRELYRVAGPPDPDALKAAYERNLAEAETSLAYYAGKDSDWDKAQAERLTEQVAWRRELLEGLDADRPE